MRLDNFVSDTGIVKRRTVAKELADGGHIKINGRRAKPSHIVKIGDIIEITGKQQVVIKVRKIPEGRSVSRESRSEYFEVLSKTPIADLDL